MATTEAVKEALSHSQTIDITTTGRRSGKKRRIEITSHSIGGRTFISGMPSPRRRNWLSNLDSDPHFTFHLKGRVRADLPATARIIDDAQERRELLEHVARAWKRNDVDRMVEQSPLIEVLFEPNKS